MIESIKCDIWRFYGHARVVIPTNIGWTHAGLNVMGRGLARQAVDRFPEIAREYGEHCQIMKENTGIWLCNGGLVLFPVKPLDKARPNMSWKQDASLELIERSTKQLASLSSNGAWLTAVPLVGCGNGRLKEEDVLPILRRHLDDSFILVRPG